VTQWLRQQFLQGEASEIVQRMALEEVVRPLQQQSEAMALLDIAATFDEVSSRVICSCASPLMSDCPASSRLWII
jgi:hypothetical protein